MENKFTQVDMTKDPQDMESYEIGLALYDIVHDKTQVHSHEELEITIFTAEEVKIIKLACDHLIALGIN